MTTHASTLSPSFFTRLATGQWWSDFRTRCRFKFVLPHVRHVTLQGVTLDVSALSSRMKNNLRLGRYEVPEQTLARQALTADDAVLEIGGAIGFMGLFCQLRLGITRYTTVEANPETVEVLQRNYLLNQRLPRVWNVALAAKDGEVTLNLGGDFWENSLLSHTPHARQVIVPAATLATLIRRLSYAPTALLIDIEGAEQFVDFQQVPPSVKKIIIELHPELIGRDGASRIINSLRQLGFQLHRKMGATFLLCRA